MISVPVSQYAPKFGNLNNSEPAVQGEVTINTYLRTSEFNIRNYEIAQADDDHTVFPYGKIAPVDTVQGVEEHEVALLLRETPADPLKPESGKKRYREGAIRPKGKKVDNYPLVITSLSGLFLKFKDDKLAAKFFELPVEVQKAYIRRVFCPIGVIGTPSHLDSEDNRYTYPYFPTRLAGVFSVQNGPYRVMTGEHLVIDAPKPNKNGFVRESDLDAQSRLDKSKATMEVVPLRIAEMASFTAMEEWFTNLTSTHLAEVLATSETSEDLVCWFSFLKVNLELLEKLSESDLNNADDYKKAFKDHRNLLRKLYKAYFQTRTELAERVFGRALQNIPRGAEGDVYVGKGYFC